MAHARYTIVGKLADGGMAEIFLAVQHGAQGFTKPVVLKRVLAAFSADPQFRNMFLDEAHISMSLAHGNIVQVLDVGVSGERTFLVLELVEGWDLERILERAQATGPGHPWPPSLALYVTAQVCRALAYAHAKRDGDGRPLGIVHRDVSPNNVLISEQGEVKLADFGIAKAERKREQTLAGVIKGKIAFMSPEQALGQPLDARADLFSLGTVVYLMLTGRRPFEAGSELESLLRAQKAEYRPPEQLNPYLSPDAAGLVNRAMRGDPAARYQTADEMLADVERVLRAEYRSAGQTELKGWLDELGLRDHAVPAGRGSVALSAVSDAGARPTFVDVEGELSAGSSVELSDFGGGHAPTQVAGRATTPIGAAPSSATAAATATDVAVAVAATQVGTGTTLPGAGTAALPGAVVVESTAPTLDVHGGGAPGRSGRRGRVGVGFAFGAVCMLGAVFGIRWLAEWAAREPAGAAHPPHVAASADTNRVADQAGRPSPVAGGAAAVVAVGTGAGAGTPSGPSAGAATGGASANGPAPVAAADPARATPASGSDGAAAAVPAAPVAAGESAPASVAGARAAKENDDDEEKLLGRVRADAAAVIGEEEAEEPVTRAGATESAKPGNSAAGKVAAAHGATAHGATSVGSRTKATSGRAAAAAHTPVQVRITSSPLGAVVRTKKQVLGRTPLAIRFNPGSTYELTFVKSGYLTNSRRLAVSSGKPQSISVALKKAPPAPKRRFFLR